MTNNTRFLRAFLLACMVRRVRPSADHCRLLRRRTRQRAPVERRDRGVPKVIGFMYTTWENKYDLLEAYGKALRGEK